MRVCVQIFTQICMKLVSRGNTIAATFGRCNQRPPGPVSTASLAEQCAHETQGGGKHKQRFSKKHRMANLIPRFTCNRECLFRYWRRWSGRRWTNTYRSDSGRWASLVWYLLIYRRRRWSGRLRWWTCGQPKGLKLQARWSTCTLVLCSTGILKDTIRWRLLDGGFGCGHNS